MSMWSNRPRPIADNPEKCTGFQSQKLSLHLHNAYMVIEAYLLNNQHY